ncbi:MULTISPECIES: tyrosine-type recombinase/integrase [unclassified Burkholderia]|uniref:tyrosine-type recombinase/integrase n=1 Tax=unclassified Burkholderia TaxID=2613784 RepID=UPI00214FD5A5|nr:MULTISPECIES: tyrosine-type recombinase/integrase [unclassified Burkholderia]MCR4471850.1 tyrosine-type recombinase/integrase [Burkholderia sp. SCN-KJ]
MDTFLSALTAGTESYITLQRALGYQFRKQAATLRAFLRYVRSSHAGGPLSQALAVDFVMASNLTSNGRAICYGVVRRFAEYYAAFDPCTGFFDHRVLPRSRHIPPPRILSDEELRSLMNASVRVSIVQPLRGQTLATLIGLLASTGLRSGEALRLDGTDVDLSTGILQIRKTKFRKDRLVPVHATTLVALQAYARYRDLAFPVQTSSAFFVSTRGTRLSPAGLHYGFHQACELAGLKRAGTKSVRPHDLRAPSIRRHAPCALAPAEG